MKFSLRTLMASLALPALVSACDVPPEEPTETTEHALRRGRVSAARPEVGAIFFANGALCTGTLVGPHTVITAAHCVNFRNAPLDGRTRAHFVVSRTAHVSGGVGYPVDGWVSIGREFPNSDVNYNAFVRQADDDVALLHLIAPITSVAPALISAAVPGPNQLVTVFGYGQHGCTPTGENGKLDGYKREFSFIYKRETFPACPSDSGGPYFTANGAIFATVVGIGRDPVTADLNEFRSRLIDDLPRIRRLLAAWR